MLATVLSMSLVSMQAIYVVHPTALLKSWILLLRLQEPEIYSKVSLRCFEGHTPSGLRVGYMVLGLSMLHYLSQS
jgi:hypothetical protein